MFERVTIKNFKSIKALEFEARRINILIGEPNAGKSNIIEALSLFSVRDHGLRSYVRYSDVSDLFSDNQINQVIEITLGIHTCSIDFAQKSQQFQVKFQTSGHVPHTTKIDIHGNGFLPADFPVRFYKYDPSQPINHPAPGTLAVPFGQNLGSIVLSNAGFKKLISEIFKSKGFRLNIKPIERELLISKEVGDDIYSYAYGNISETLKRIVFFMGCLETNKGTTLLFDEPEANTFPFYIKYLAERIALDDSNQFFFTTHNPTLLRSVVEKAKVDDVQVLITFMEEFETKVRVLNSSELRELLETDVFFNLDYFIKNEAQS